MLTVSDLRNQLAGLDGSLPVIVHVELELDEELDEIDAHEHAADALYQSIPGIGPALVVTM